MTTDDERRRVAERLRCAAEQRQPYTQPTLACFIGADCVDIWTRLAELIEPAPTSSDRGRTPDPTERGIDSIYDWCFECIEGADGAEDFLYCTIMSAIEEYRHPERVTARTARPVDREGLLALTDGIVDAARDSSNIGIEGEFAEVMRKLARNIRVLCGEEDS